MNLQNIAAPTFYNLPSKPVWATTGNSSQENSNQKSTRICFDGNSLPTTDYTSNVVNMSAQTNQPQMAANLDFDFDSLPPLQMEPSPAEIISPFTVCSNSFTPPESSHDDEVFDSVFGDIGDFFPPSTASSNVGKWNQYVLDPSMPREGTFAGPTTAGEAKRKTRQLRAHSKAEKRYRSRLGQRFNELKDCIPNLRSLPNGAVTNLSSESDDESLVPETRVNKATILVEAMRYIKHLEKKQAQQIQ